MLGRGDRLLAVRRLWRSDDDCADIRTPQQGLYGRLGVDAVVPSKRRRPRAAGDCDQSRVLVVACDALGVGAPHVARADNADSKLPVIHLATLLSRSRTSQTCSEPFVDTPTVVERRNEGRRAQSRSLELLFLELSSSS